jgi:hypothetical protein
MKIEKILTAIDSAINNLEHSIKKIIEKDEKELSDYVWKAASDSEYALFLLSLIKHDKNEEYSWKPKISFKIEEIELTVSLAQENLKEAHRRVEANELQEAYNNVITAQEYIFKVQKEHRKDKN